MVLELLGYAGAAAALSATAVTADGASIATQIVIGLLTTLALVAAGWLMGTKGDELLRMRSVFWFLAVLAWVSVAKGLVGPEGLDLDGKWTIVVGGGLTALLAVPLWWRTRRSLQLIAAFFSLHLPLAALVSSTRSTLFGLGPDIPDLTWSAVVTAVFGAVALALGWRELLHPRRTAMVLGALALGVGLPAAFVDLQDLATGGGSDLPVWISLLTGAAVLAIGSRTRVVAVTGLGIAQLAASIVVLIGDNVTETGPAVVVLMAGLVLVAAAAYLARDAAR